MMQFKRLGDTYRGDIDRDRFGYETVYVNPLFVVEIRYHDYADHATVEMHNGDTWIAKGTSDELQARWWELVERMNPRCTHAGYGPPL